MSDQEKESKEGFSIILDGIHFDFTSFDESGALYVDGEFVCFNCEEGTVEHTFFKFAEVIKTFLGEK